jgi:peptidyl-prolyl cis-trans isomerase B (cyclophilin B)
MTEGSIKLKFAVCVFLAMALSGSTSCRHKIDPTEVGVLETNYGRIVIEFLPEIAPNHVANFKELAREGFYDGTRFHRLVKDKDKPVAVQGGDPNSINGDPSTWGQGQPGQKTLKAEISANLKHERGTVSAARKPKDKDSATSQFFICIAAQPLFDGDYTIFGRVIEGMNVVDSIGRAPLVKGTERPLDPVVVSKAYIVKREELK